MIHRHDVVINGGGLIGLALGCALADAGIKVAIMEGHQEPPPFDPGTDYGLRVVALNRASQQLLTNLGAWERLQSWRVSPYQRMHVWDAGSSGSISFSAGDLDEPNLGHIVETPLICRALYEQFITFNNAEWINAETKTIAIDDQDAIVTLGDGRILSARLLVGADGRDSMVREAAGIELGSRHYQQKGIVATVETERHGDYTAWQRFLPDGVIAFLPFSDGRSSIVWSTRDADRLMALDDVAFTQALGDAFDHHLGEILAVSERAAFPLIGQHASCYVKPRIALIGDAAHTVHPLAGQGANLGLMDVAQLTQELIKSQRDLGSYAVLRKYERARMGENSIMQKLMEGFQTLFMNQSPRLSMLRGLGMSLSHEIAPLKARMMQYALGTQGNLPELAKSRCIRSSAPGY